MRPRRTTTGTLAQAVHALAYEVFQERYQYNAAGFVVDCFDWKAIGDKPTPYQLEILEALTVEKRVSVRGSHGLGKTSLASWALWWFSLTRDGKDWKVPTTASVWRQLREYLWPDVHKWHRYLRWDVIGRPPVSEPRELQQMALRLDTGSAVAIASNQPSALEGAHADHLLFIYDESKAIPDPTFDATEGAFSGASPGSGKEALAIAMSTPGPPQGRFYAIHTHRPGLEDWWTRHVKIEEAVAAGRVSGPWAEQREKQWGASSPMYRNRVLGEFASDETAVIPLEWVEAAVERWLALPLEPDGGVAVNRQHRAVHGCDVADGGADLNTVAERWGPVIRFLDAWEGLDLMDTAGRFMLAQRSTGGLLVVDVIGIGSGVVARLREQGVPVVAFNAAERTDFVERSGEIGFQNKRSAAWWNMRELLDPDSGIGVCLPPDDQLVSDLTTPRYRTGSGGKILVEPKDGTPSWGIRQRLGRSTDAGDGVVTAFFSDVLLWEDEEPGSRLVEYEGLQPGHISPV